MHFVGQVDAAFADQPVVSSTSSGLTRRVLVGPAQGSVHTELAVGALAPSGWLARHVHSFEEVAVRARRRAHPGARPAGAPVAGGRLRAHPHRHSPHAGGRRRAGRSLALGEHPAAATRRCGRGRHPVRQVGARRGRSRGSRQRGRPSARPPRAGSATTTARHRSWRRWRSRTPPVVGSRQAWTRRCWRTAASP